MIANVIPVGDPAPLFMMKAVATERTFRLADLRGRPVLLVFVNQNTARTPQEIVPAIRRRYPDVERLAIAVVVDLRIVPGLLQGAVKRIMEGAFHEAAREIPTPYDPADHLILLPDWKGQVTAAYGATDSGAHPILILIDQTGAVHATHRGPHAAQGALEMISRLFGDS